MSAYLALKIRKKKPPSPPRNGIPASIKKSVLVRFGGRCGYCGEMSERLEVDHIKAFGAGGAEEIGNLMPACRPCNNFKGIFTLEQFRNELEKQVERATKYSVNFRMAKKFDQIQETPSPIVFYFEKASQ